jgi:hypothetical protein
MGAARIFSRGAARKFAFRLRFKPFKSVVGDCLAVFKIEE